MISGMILLREVEQKGKPLFVPTRSEDAGTYHYVENVVCVDDGKIVHYITKHYRRLVRLGLQDPEAAMDAIRANLPVMEMVADLPTGFEHLKFDKGYVTGLGRFATDAAVTAITFAAIKYFETKAKEQQREQEEQGEMAPETLGGLTVRPTGILRASRASKAFNSFRELDVRRTGYYAASQDRRIAGLLRASNILDKDY